MSRRPDDEGWRRQVLVRAHRRTLTLKRGTIDMGRLQMTVGAGYLARLAEAAALRDLTVGAYIRRAVAAFVAADLDMPITDLLADVPHPQGVAYGHHDDGEGHGLWTGSAFANDTVRIPRHD